MKTKRLVRHGNSYALIIEKPILEILGITAETPLEVETDGRGLIVRPALAPDFVEAARWVFGRYRKTFRDLAEHDKGRKRKR